MTRQTSLFVLVTTILLLFVPAAVLAQTGVITSGENQRVGKIVGVASLEEGAQPRYVVFVGIARKQDKTKTVNLAVGIGGVNSASSGLESERKPLWSVLTLEEAKQASKALRQMGALAKRDTSGDATNKNLSYQTANSFSLQYQEFVSGRVFTISVGEGGGRRCEFIDTDYIKLTRGSIDDGIKWMESRFKPVPKYRFGPPYTPKTSEEKAVIVAFRKSSKYGYMQKVTSLNVDGAWACGVCVDVQEHTDGGQFVAHKGKGTWKIVAEGSLIYESLEDNHIVLPARLKKKWWGE